MPDYEDMILAKQEAYDIAGDCDYDCSNCFCRDVCYYANSDEGIDDDEDI